MATPRGKATVASAPSGVPAMTAAQIAALIATLPVAEQQQLRAQVKSAASSAKAQERGRVEVAQVGTGESAGKFQIDIALGAHPGVSGDGRAYLFQADGVRFEHGGKTYQLSAIYALEVRK